MTDMIKRLEQAKLTARAHGFEATEQALDEILQREILDTAYVQMPTKPHNLWKN